MISPTETLREKCKTDLYFLNKSVLGFTDLDKNVHIPLCRFLNSPGRFKQCVMPRGWFKTTNCSVGYPIQRAIQDPDITILIAMNTKRNAEKRIHLIRDIFMKNRFFGQLFPELIPRFRHVRWSDECAEIERPTPNEHGTFESAGANTGVISGHWDLIIVDDLCTPDFDQMDTDYATPTKEQIAKSIGWIKSAFSLLSDQKTGEMVGIATHWAVEDYLYWLKHHPVASKLFKWFEMTSRDGDGAPIWPEKFGEEELARLKGIWGSAMYNMLYMNNPISSEDSPFKPEHFRYYDKPPDGMRIVITCDPAISEEKRADFSAFVALGTPEKGGHYVLDAFKRKITPMQVVNTIFNLHSKWKSTSIAPIKVGVECVAFQKALKYMIQEEMRRRHVYFTIDEMKRGTGESKDMRIRAISPVHENGGLFVQSHMRELYDEMIAYPRAGHDDLCDALADAIALAPPTYFTPKKKREPNPNYSDPLAIDDIIDRMFEKHEHGKMLYGYSAQVKG